METKATFPRLHNKVSFKILAEYAGNLKYFDRQINVGLFPFKERNQCRLPILRKGTGYIYFSQSKCMNSFY